MPRNGSGTYTLPSGNPVVAGDLIEATWANNTLSDVANEITNSLDRNGNGGMLAPFRLADGTLGAPGVAWLNEPSTGFYRAGSGEQWAVVSGQQIAQFTTTGLLIPTGKTLTVTGGINSTPIGSTTPSTGAFTTLSATGAISQTASSGNPTLTLSGSGAYTSVVTLNGGSGGSGYITSGSGASLRLNAPTGQTVTTEINNTVVTSASSTGLAVTGALSATSIVSGNSAQFTGANAPSSGSGVEVLYTGATGKIQAYNRTGSAFLPLTYEATYHAFNISGAEVARLDTSGNLGLGVTPSAWLSGGGFTQVPGNGFYGNNAGFSSNAILLGTNAYYDTSWKYKTSSLLAAYYQVGNGTHTWYTAPSGTAGNAITFTQAMTLSGTDRTDLAVGGTALPYNAANRGSVHINGATDGLLGFYVSGAAGGYVYATTSGLTLGAPPSRYIAFDINGEKMRLDSSGNLLVGATSQISNALLGVKQATGTSNVSAMWNSATTGNNGFLTFGTEGTYTERGYIYYNRGAGQTQLSATSDGRLKEEINDVGSTLDIVRQMRVRSFKWKETGNTNVGFVAQELHQVVPEAVCVGEDNPDGSVKRHWGVSKEFLVPYLVKAIQELEARIQALEAA